MSSPGMCSGQWSDSMQARLSIMPSIVNAEGEGTAHPFAQAEEHLFLQSSRFSW
ncbi:hypothetical protein [Paenibacillus zanthoxyli]|uniref:hypothetical protein n=1 Tax=Paenibacillus zanthoxyli TaxID=369399 RepID=UPI0004BAEE16|nr:hypothetical protein [Paenibacillus zanthoxyli]